MKIPERVKIGAHWIDIVFKEMEGNDGMYESHLNRITIDPTLPPSQQCATFFHEVLHACNPTMDDTNTYGHALLASLAEQLYQVFSDNNILRD